MIPNNYPERKPKGHSCSFADFIDYFLTILDPVKYPKFIEFDETTKKNVSRELQLDVHFMSQTYNCFPCSMDFDYIARTEHGTEDANYIIKKLFPGTTAQILPKYKEDNAILHSQTIDKDFHMWLPEDLKMKLRRHFKWELEMFGYDY